jgi:hypothetical protein
MTAPRHCGSRSTDAPACQAAVTQALGYGGCGSGVAAHTRCRDGPAARRRTTPRSVGEQVDRPVSVHVDQHGAVVVAASQGEVVYSDRPDHARFGTWDRVDQAQHHPGRGHAQPVGQACAGTSTQGQPDPAQCLVPGVGGAPVPVGQAGNDPANVRRGQLVAQKNLRAVRCSSTARPATGTQFEGSRGDRPQHRRHALPGLPHTTLLDTTSRGHDPAWLA